MILMRNATGNVYKRVHHRRVDDYLRKGFLIVSETGVGSAPPPQPEHEEVIETETVIEAPAIIEERTDNPLMMDGLYPNQMNRTQLMAWMDREGLPYNKRGTKADFLKIYEAYKKELKAKK